MKYIVRAAFFIALILIAPAAKANDKKGENAASENNSALIACEKEISDLIEGKPPTKTFTPPKCARGNYDAIIILGYPANEDGTLSEVQERRVDMAMQFYEAGYARMIIPSGGAVHNDFVEADVIKKALVERGVPAENVIPEPLARHTDENIYWSSKIMEEHGWKTAIMISDTLVHLMNSAMCDSNCCAKMGRTAPFNFKFKDKKSILALRYTLHPYAPGASDKTCSAMKVRMQCPNLEDRRACEGREWRLEQDGKN